MSLRNQKTESIDQPPSKETAVRPITMKHWLLLFVWALGIAAVVTGGAMPDHYESSVLSLQGPQPYPWSGVMLFCVIVTFESIFLGCFLKPVTGARSWKPLLGALVLVIGLIFSFGAAAMHSPPHQHMHLLWLLAVGFALLVATLLATVASAKSRLRKSN